MTTQVAEIMSVPVLTIDQGDSLWDAWQMLSVSGLRHLIVVDRNGQCLGVVRDRNILADPPLNEAHLAAKQIVSIVPAPPPICLGPQDSPKHAAKLMTGHDMEALPVCTSDGKVIGIVSQGDLLNYVD